VRTPSPPATSHENLDGQVGRPSLGARRPRGCRWKILSSSALDSPTKGPAILPSVGSGLPGFGTQCTWTFTLTGVPDDKAQYAVEIGHWGKVVNSRAEMQADGWTFALSLGGP
jgi:hypothetical protein